jgi:hypothetical protein
LREAQLDVVAGWAGASPHQSYSCSIVRSHSSATLLACIEYKDEASSVWNRAKSISPTTHNPLERRTIISRHKPKSKHFASVKAWQTFCGIKSISPFPQFGN